MLYQMRTLKIAATVQMLAAIRNKHMSQVFQRAP